MPRRYWLFKTEPNVFSIHNLQASPQQATFWDGVRNYQARNILRDEVQEGDGVLFYHSRVDPMAVVGTAVVSKRAYPDPTQFDRRSKYYDPAAKKDEPRWYGVEITLETIFQRPVTLKEMREAPKLKDMPLLRKGMRLSVQPVTKAQWDYIVHTGAGSA